MKTLLILLLPLALFARPQNVEVQHGSASIHEKGKHVRIENSPNAILHWQDFSIAQGESVHFSQEHAKSTVLNRVTSGQTSHLLGKLTSNGAVFLINPSGVLIGADAHIQTAGFLASTADISNENFLKGHYLFSSPGEGHVTNHGVIQCPQGDIYLIAKTIQNTGTLQAENVSQVSGYEVLITPHANEKVSVRLELDASKVTILTQDLHATNPYEKAIHHTGYIEAFGSKEENGKVYLIAHKREITVEGSIKAPGGDPKVVGEEVYIAESATLDASGPRGGSLSIGKGFGTLVSQKTTLEKGAILSTSGTEDNAGNILIWSETDTYCAATIEAAALGTKGDGGFLEISGKNIAEAPLIPNLSSQNGKTGTILLDPGAITVTNGASPGTGGIYGVTYLQGLLASSNVALNTSTGTAGPETLIITSAVTGANALTWASNFDLSLTAGSNIEVQSSAQISFSGSGTLTATALGSIAGQTHPGISLSGLSLSATGSGNITLIGTGGDTGTGNEGIRIQGATNLSTATGTLIITGNGGSASHGISITSGILQTTGTGTLDLTGVGGSGANTNGIRLSGGGVDILAPVNGTISLTGTGGGTGAGAHGVLVTSSAQVRPLGTSTLAINGAASPTSTGSFGIYPIGTNAITVADGPMNLVAVGGGVGNDNVGIRITGGTPITSTGSGDINIDATGTSTGDNNNYGIYLTGSSNISAQGSGHINITNAIGSSASPSMGGGNNGIRIVDANGGFFTNLGAIDITATGGTQATGNENIGINLTGSTGSERIESTSGAINIIAKGAPNGGSNNRGIVLEDTTRIGGNNPRVIRTGGAIDITAVGGGPTSGGGNIGILCLLEGRIQSIGSTGSLIINATTGGGRRRESRHLP